MAIAVDNLANAHELTKDEEEEQAAEEEVSECERNVNRKCSFQKRQREAKDVESMFKIGGSPTETATTTPVTNTKTKKPDQQPLLNRNNLKQTTKKDYVENAVKTAFDIPSANATNTKADDFLDRHLIQKADLDYIPGLDYDLGPVFLPSKEVFVYFDR